MLEPVFSSTDICLHLFVKSTLHNSCVDVCFFLLIQNSVHVDEFRYSAQQNNKSKNNLCKKEDIMQKYAKKYASPRYIFKPIWSQMYP